MKPFRYLLFLLLSSGSLLFAQAEKLKRTDIPNSMQQMLNYHVEFKEFNPLLVKRSFKVFIEQSDPEKIYLLAGDLKPFLEGTDKDLELAVQRYKAGDFSDYEALNGVIEKAIKRARELREEVERELILNFEEPVTSVGETYLQYATTSMQLRERIKKKLIRFMAAERESKAREKWGPDERSRVFAFLEKRLRRLEETYFGKGDKKEHYFSMHILKAMAKSLDAHTAFFSPEEAFEMRTSLEKEFEGVGVVLKEDIEGVVIVDLIKGGPAEKSGKIQKGDLLVEIDGKSIVDAPYEEVLSRMKGKGGRDLELGVKRQVEAQKEQHVRIQLKREKIVMEDDRLHYSAEPLGDGLIAKLVLPSFYESSDHSSCERDMREALLQLKSKGKILGLVLDLRENSGGFLNQAVKVAGLFITSGVIVISKYAEGEMQYLRTIDGRIFYDGPMLILTSKASASAAEIVAQALQDYGSALVVGDERTYGKGTIQYQTVTDKEAAAFFKVTVGKYYTVSGRSTQIEGVKADIVVPTEYSVYNIGERYLEYPLKNDQLPSAYVDPLSDVDQKSRVWFQKNYLPNLQKKQSQWIKMLPQLRTNTAYRLEHDKNFKIFLQTIQPSEVAKGTPTNFGLEDLQMAEAVRILQDMILLQPQVR